MGGDARFGARVRELGVTQDELARQMNDAHEKITGSPGEYSSRTVRYLLEKTKRPSGKTCAVLERVFGCPVEDLGFTPPRTAAPREDDVRRRAFLNSATGTAVAPLLAQRRTVGMTDVRRVAAGLSDLVEADDRQGGHETLERRALHGRGLVLDFQKGNASEQVRRALFALAAEFTTIAAWSCIDVRQLDRAQRYLNESIVCAGLSQDNPTEMRVWVNMSMLAYQRGNWTEALAAAHAAQGTRAAHRDPFFGSLGKIRVALAHAGLGDQRAAVRSLGSAQEALHRSAHRERPRWTAFYGAAEVDHLAAVVHGRDHPEKAEAMAHRALGKIPKEFRRNRALATARLALAQLHQGEVEQATTSAGDVFRIMDGTPLPGRMRTLIGDFQRDLFVLAPTTAYAREWSDRMRSEWRSS
ncbi:XRE family transcriptional regulator [Streptomyces sp. SR27]|uniref:XRE family transcriptional regulator n=1 Tax=Streptomyces sp. SR27 TaxID=3076630 RepID=UPI00295B59F7|nr:XRE family transcriptional regulator [Streptomyces sp. SR27]MDV9190059.1 XRE family transcriptional regulator [Streptomyces sp. SR27]